MSDHEGTSTDTGFSTPVPELDDHTRHQSPVAQRPRSRRGTVGSIHVRTGFNPDLGLVNDELLRTKARDFGDVAYDEEAVHDEENSALPSPQAHRYTAARSRRGTATTLDPRSASPPNSVKAFADARRRERKFSSDDQELHRATSRATLQSHRSRLTRQHTNDSDVKSAASSHNSAEDDVCFPFDTTANKSGLNIDYEALEDFIEEEARAKANQVPRVFKDLRNPSQPSPMPVFTSDGDFISCGSLPLKEEKIPEDFHNADEPKVVDHNRFEYFSSCGETTIHAAELGDLVMPDEDIRSLFTFPEGEEEEGVWWLNMNNPTEKEIAAICKSFRVHPLTFEDIKCQEAREKIELFPGYYFASFRSFQIVEEEDGQDYEPFNIYVIVFRQGTLSFSFEPNKHASLVRERVVKLKDYMDLSSDWLCYALIDHVVDAFGPVISKIEHETEMIEDQVFIARDEDMHVFLRKIGVTRKNVMGLMRLLGGKADVLRGFTKRCNANYAVAPRMDVGLYLGDIQDHVVTMMTNLGHFEKMLSRSHSNYLAQLSIDNISQGNRSNKVLSKITVFASILVPLNLVCGLFGMNVHVPFAASETTSLAPFFGILGFLVFFVVLSLVIAKRYRYV